MNYFNLLLSTFLYFVILIKKNISQTQILWPMEKYIMLLDCDAEEKCQFFIMYLL